MITFDKITIEGFKSIREMEFPFHESGVYLIKAPNGTGKSTVFEAIYFCLFGKDMKGENLDSVLTLPEYRTRDYRGCRVSLDLFKNGNKYTITRTHKYKNEGEKFGSGSLNVYEDGDSVSERLKRDSQQVVNDILGVSENVFMNSVMFGQNMRRFMETSGEDKKEIFSSFFELDWIDRARERAAALYSEYTTKEREAQEQERLLQSKIESLMAERDRYDQYISGFEEDKINKIAGLQNQVDLLPVLEIKTGFNQDAFELLKKELEDCRTEYYTTQSENQSKEREMRRIEADIKRMKETKIEENCPTCGGVIKQEVVFDLKNKIELDIMYAERDLSRIILQDLSDLRAKGEDLKRQVDVMVIQKTNQENNNSLLESVDRHKKIILHLIEIEKNSQPVKSIDFTEEINKLEEKIQMIDAGQYKTTIATLKWWQSTGFGGGGLKAYIVNDILKRLNLIINKYAERLDMSIEIKIDTEKARKGFITLVYKSDGTPVNFQALSGGEKQRINLSISFAIFDMIEMSAGGFNFMVFDEAFNGLDQDGIFEIHQMLKDRAVNKQIIIVTHGDKMDIMHSGIYNLEKINNQTILS
jgi:DNA repair exonuclease SbcCD ATPase subunit